MWRESVKQVLEQRVMPVDTHHQQRMLGPCWSMEQVTFL